MAIINGDNNNNFLVGTSNVFDVLFGLGGNDVLNGGVGPDGHDGGAGDDTYVIDHPEDVIIELPNQGNDVIDSFISFNLETTPSVERARLSDLGPGGANLTLRGNALNNELFGNQGNNIFNGLAGDDLLRGNGGSDTLNGGLGIDRMEGGEGDDVFFVDNVGDVVVENAGEGIDTVLASISYTLTANVERLEMDSSPDTTPVDGTGNELDNFILGSNAQNTLRGLAGNDELRGGGGNDTLEGGAGTDQLLGGLGDDLYIIGDAADIVTEAANAGTDTVQASVSYVLTANVENLTLTGASNLNGTGNDLNNVIIGNAGNNALDGKGGNDTLSGGLGNDIYMIGDAGDEVTEAVNAGTDTVQASVSYALTANVENLTLTGTANINGTGNDLNNELTGNAGNNLLDGGGGNDRLDGGAGADQLLGGLGDDLYIISDAADLASEAVNAGIDTVQASVSYVLGANIENLTLTGTGNIDGTGNDAGNILLGNAGVNVLNGAAGNDILFSGAGRDSMTGGTGADLFVLSAPRSGVDRVQDFNRREGDKLVVDLDDFAGLRTGSLRRNQFVQGTKALDKNDRFIYNQRNGALFYDADGRGGAGQVRIAILGSKPALAASDIIAAASPF